MNCTNYCWRGYAFVVYGNWKHLGMKVMPVFELTTPGFLFSTNSSLFNLAVVFMLHTAIAGNETLESLTL